MKKLLIGTFLIIATCMLINTSLIFETGKKAVPPTVEPKISSNILTYTVKDFNGNIAVFSSAGDKPMKIIDVNTASLPKADQEMLLKGIIVKSQLELNGLLEDLCS